MAEHKLWDVLHEMMEPFDSVILLLQTMGSGTENADDFTLSGGGIMALGKIADVARYETETRLEHLNAFLKRNLGDLSIETPTPASPFIWRSGFPDLVKLLVTKEAPEQ